MSPKVTKLFWIDMEMSGLDVETEVIIEVAAIITDLNLKEIDSYEAVVKQPQHYISAMDDWNKAHHTQSGLIAKIPFGSEPETVEQNLIRLVKKHWSNAERPVLAGNSIHQDKIFIDKYFLELSPLLHYRMLDVSSWKIIFKEKLNFSYNKNNNHRALDDIRESIQELQAYLRFIKDPNSDSAPA
jgi:oligoribonuclease